MFDSQYKFYGKHADMVRTLTAVFDEKSGAKVFARNYDVLINAPLVGFLYQRKADENHDGGPENDTNIFAEQIIRVSDQLKFVMRLIILLDKEYQPDADKRLDEAFRYFGKDDRDYQLFQQYARGGVEVLYEKLVQDGGSPIDYANRIYEFTDEFNDRFNAEISNQDIIDKCAEFEK